MNGENINNGGENLEIRNEALDRAFGKATLGAEYLSSDEVALDLEQKRIEEEQAKNEEEMKAILEQFKKAKQERARLLAEEQARLAEVQKIAEKRREKSVAMKRGLIGVTGWYNKHPEELGEILHKNLQPYLAQYQKEHAEMGKSFYNVIKESMRLEEIDAQMAALQNERNNIINTVKIVPEGESDESAEEFDAEAIVDQAIAEVDAEDAEKNEPKSFEVNYPVFNGLNDEDLSYPIEDDSEEQPEEIDDEESDLSYPVDDESEVTDGADVNVNENKDPVLDEYVQEVAAQILAGGARELELQRNKQKQATSSENVSAAVDEVIDNKAEQEKNEKVEKVKRKFGLKHGFKKLLMKSTLIKTAVAAAVAAIIALSVVGDANAIDETKFSKVATEESVGGGSDSAALAETMAPASSRVPAENIMVADAPNVDSADVDSIDNNGASESGVKYGSREYEENTGKPKTRVVSASESGVKYGSREYEENTGKPKTRSVETSSETENAETGYDSTFNFVKADGETGEYTLDFHQQYRENALDLFDVDVMEKGGEQTSNNKESKLAFGPILDTTELEGGKDVLIYLSRKGERMAGDALYMMYANSWNGALDASDGYDINVEHVSVDGINSSARKFESASLEEKQKILDKIMEDEAEAVEGRTMQYATFPAGKTYITAHMEKGEDGIKKIVVAKSSKPTEFNVLQRLNENGENEFDQGETKLRILKAHGLADADMTLEQAEQRGLMKRYTVWGERNKCGGQMVITENIARKKAPKSENDQVVTTTTVTQEIIPVAPVTPNNSTPPDDQTPPNEPSPNVPVTPVTPTPELQGKTTENVLPSEYLHQEGPSEQFAVDAAQQGNSEAPAQNYVPTADAMSASASAPSIPIDEGGISTLVTHNTADQVNEAVSRIASGDVGPSSTGDSAASNSESSDGGSDGNNSESSSSESGSPESSNSEGEGQ